MAETNTTYLIDVALETAKISKALKDIFTLLDQRDKLEKANDDKKTKLLQDLVKGMKELIDLNKKILLAEENRLTVQKAITTELRTQASLTKDSFGVARPAGGGGMGGDPFPRGGGGGGAGGGGGGPTPPGDGGPGRIAGFFGSLGANAMTGFQAGLGLDAAMQTAKIVRDLTTSVKQYIMASGPLEQAQKAFSVMARKNGEDAEQLAQKLDKASNGLVDSKVQLTQATKLMQAGVSSTDVQKYFQALTDVARVQGKDVPQAMESTTQALIRGRTQMIPLTLGIDLNTRALYRNAQQLPENERLTKQLAITVEAANRKVVEMGGRPTDTFTERLEQMSQATSNFFESMAGAVTESAGFKDFMILISDLMKRMAGEGKDIAVVIGDTIGNAIGILVEALRLLLPIWDLFVSVVKSQIVLFKTLAQPVVALAKYFSGDLASGASIAEKRLTTLKGMMITLAQVATALSTGVEKLVIRLQFFSDISSKGFWASAENMTNKLEEADKVMVEKLQKLQDDLEGKEGPEPVVPPHVKEIDEDLENKLKKQAIDLQTFFVNNEADAQKERLEHTRSFLDKMMEMGRISAREKLNLVQHVINEEEDAEQKRLEQLAALKIKEIWLDKVTNKALLQGQENMVRAQLSGDIAKLHSATSKKREDENYKEFQRQIALSKKAAEIEVEANLAAKQQEAEATERLFKTGKLSNFAVGTGSRDSLVQARAQAEEYVAIKREQIQDEYREEIQAANRKQLLSHNSEEAKLQFAEDAARAIRTLRKREADFEIEQYEIVANAVKRRYDQEKALIEAKMQGPQRVSQRSSVQSLIGLEAERLGMATAERSSLGSAGVGSERWHELNLEIQQATNKIYEYTKSLRTTQEATATLLQISGGFFGQIGAGGVGSALSAGGGVFATMAGFAKSRKIGQDPNLLGSLSGAIGTLFGKQETDKVTGEKIPLEEFGDRLGNVTEIMGSAFQAIGGMVQAFKQQGAVAGAVGGGLALGGMGKMIGSLPMFGEAGGPIGAVIGMAAGAIIGGIVGAAKKKTEELAKGLSKAFNGIVEALNAGSTNLKTAITDLEAQRQKTVSQLSGRKGGREQLDSLLPGMDQQIAGLKKQRADLDKALKDELKVLRAPEMFEGTIKSLDQIIKRYEELAGAAYDSAEAQEYLTLTLERYVAQQQRELNASEKTAIENAIQLNDLYETRAKIIEGAAQQEYDVRTSGVLQKQRTVAQQKSSAISEIEKARDEQLKSINKQIDLAKMRVDAERLIFGLSSDRVTLEMQLVQMQRQQISEDMKRLAMLASVASTIKSGASPAELNKLILSWQASTLPDALEGSYSSNGRKGMGGFYGEAS